MFRAEFAACLLSRRELKLVLIQFSSLLDRFSSFGMNSGDASVPAVAVFLTTKRRRRRKTKHGVL